MIIGFSGRMYSGKSEAAKYLVSKGFTKVAFADSLKAICKMVGWDGEKDARGRKLLQDLGMVVRTYNKDAWVNMLPKLVGDVVVDDIRFLNKANLIKQSGGYIVQMERFKNPWYRRVHASERGIATWDTIIHNTGSIQELHAKIDEVLEWIRTP